MLENSVENYKVDVIITFFSNCSNFKMLALR